MAAGVKEVDSVEVFNKLLNDAGGNLVVVHFAAPWAPQCKQMTDVMSELSKDSQLKQVHFLQIEAEKLAEISEKNNIIAVPTFIFFKGGKSVDRLDGANAADLTKKVRNLSSGTVVASPPPPTQKQDLNTRLKKLINSAPVLLFMKGSPQEPKCGFSRQMIKILNDKKVSYSTFDILTDEEVRQGLKTFSNWPTYPQLYANGELLGGLDIVKELVETGELESQLPVKVKLEDRLFPEDPSQLSSQSESSSSMCCQDAKTVTDTERDQTDDDKFFASRTKPLHLDGLDEMEMKGFTVTVNLSEDEGEEEEVDAEEESLPLWFSSDSCDTPHKSQAQGTGRGRGKRKKSVDKRRYIQKINQRERRALIRSDPSLLAAQREKERLRQMMIRRRDSLILSLPVDPNMSIQDANQMLMSQQKEAGVPEGDITSLQIGRENFSTIGELKKKIEEKRAVDRERTRMKRAQLDEEMREEMKKTCRDRMREKRARLREFDPAAAAAHREREKIRKRIERRRNAMLLSLPQETVVQSTEGVEEEEAGSSLMPLPLAPEFSSALLVLRENLLRKRVEQKERVRRRRAELKEKHPDVAAAIRERERIRKRIERRRNSLLLKLSSDELLKVTQSAIGQDSNNDSVTSQSFMDTGPNVAPETVQSDGPGIASDNIDRSSASDHASVSSNSGGSAFDGGPGWALSIDKLKQNIQNKKDYNKERMRQKRAKLKEDPEAFEAMKERERLRKKRERLKKKGTNDIDMLNEPLAFNPTSSSTLSSCSGNKEMFELQDSGQKKSERLKKKGNELTEILNAPLTFNYDISDNDLTSTSTQSVFSGSKDMEGGQDLGHNPVTEDGVIIKQEPIDYSDESYTQSGDDTLPANHCLYPPQDISKMKEDYKQSDKRPAGVPDDTNTLKSKELSEDDRSNSLVLSDNNGCRKMHDASSKTVTVSKKMIKLEPDLESGCDEPNEFVSRGYSVQIEKCETWAVSENLPDKCTENTNQDLDHTFAEPSSQTHPMNLPCSWDTVPSVQSNPVPDAVSAVGAGEPERWTGAGNQINTTCDGSGSVDIPSFASIEEERDWFQTQLCRLQTRVTDTVSDEQMNPHKQPFEADPRGPCISNTIPCGSPNMAVVSSYNNSVGPLTVNPFSDISKLTSTPQNTSPTNDYLSGIAEVTLRSSLEQMTALAGPEVMQDRLRQMVESAKQAREKANEQARRRREKLRNDPAMKKKYEEIKARDMERKRQQRAKEAEIRTVYPSFNEERRIRDRERKKLKRLRNREHSADKNRSLCSISDPSFPPVSPFMDQEVVGPNALNISPPGLMLPSQGAANSCPSSLYPNSAVTSPVSLGSLTQIRPPYIPQLGPEESSHQTDVRPHTPQNHSLTS